VRDEGLYTVKRWHFFVLRGITQFNPTCALAPRLGRPERIEASGELS